jgi:hypothetical protein
MRRGHIADHRYFAPEMKQAHGEALDLKALPADAVERDGSGGGDLIDCALDGRLIDTIKDAGEIAKRGVIEAGHRKGS